MNEASRVDRTTASLPLAARALACLAAAALGSALSLEAAAQRTGALATGDYEVSGVEVTLLELKRTSGDTITARWRYENKEDAAKQLTKATGWTDKWKLAMDSYVVDAANKKKYLILKDDKGHPIAGAVGSGAIKLAPHQAINTWAKYPAPPANVDKVSLYIPGVAPFEDVPIAK